MLDFVKITSALGSIKESNHDISEIVSWSAEEIYKKTGIKYRYISDTNQTAEILAEEAANKIEENHLLGIDLVISVSNTQDRDFPPIANHIHNYLNLSPDIQCYGLNHGCSGYVDAVKIVYSFFANGFANKALIVTSDTYTKFIDINDRSIRTLFSDGATCTILEKNEISGWVVNALSLIHI